MTEAELRVIGIVIGGAIAGTGAVVRALGAFDIKKKEAHSALRFRTIEELLEDQNKRQDRFEERLDHRFDKLSLKVDPLVPVISVLQEKADRQAEEMQRHRDKLHAHGNAFVSAQKTLDEHDTRLAGLEDKVEGAMQDVDALEDRVEALEKKGMP